MDDTRLTYTVPEVAKLIGISRAHAYESVRIGQLPAVRLGRRILVPQKALDDYVIAQSGDASQRVVLRWSE